MPIRTSSCGTFARARGTRGTARHNLSEGCANAAPPAVGRESDFDDATGTFSGSPTCAAHHFAFSVLCSLPCHCLFLLSSFSRPFLFLLSSFSRSRSRSLSRSRSRSLLSRSRARSLLFPQSLAFVRFASVSQSFPSPRSSLPPSDLSISLRSLLFASLLTLGESRAGRRCRHGPRVRPPLCFGPTLAWLVPATRVPWLVIEQQPLTDLVVHTVVRPWPCRRPRAR